MKKCAIFLLGFLVCSAPAAFALSIDWSGNFRFEYVNIDNVYLDSGRGGVSYLLEHLSLTPKIVVVDGINIVGDFEVLGNPSYPDGQTGQLLGAGDRSNTNMQVRELYLEINQEYGQIIAGRAPLQFGLGMTYNAGQGVFDHWVDTYDMFAYKFVIGNVSIMPIFAQDYEGSPALGNKASSLMGTIEYNNPETESAIGVFYRVRTTSDTSNSAPYYYDSTVNASYPTTAANAWKSTTTNVFFSRGWDSFKFRMEAGFQSGDTGLQAADTSEVKLGGYGIALEMEFPQKDSSLHWMLRAGIASGDNPNSDNYEGYQMNRNYDMAFLLFNHPMGAYDVLTSNAQRQRDPNVACSTPPCAMIGNGEALDEETISNAIYISPKLDYTFSDKWNWRNILTYAQTQTNPSRIPGNSVASDLGWEWDSAVIWTPHPRIQWLNEVGFFLPGGAWRDGSDGLQNNFTWGFQSKAAISF